MHKVSLLQRNRSPREEAERPAQPSGTSRSSAAEDPRDLLGRSRLHALLGFYRPTPRAPRLPLPGTESFYEEEVRELGPPGVSRAPKMRSIRKRWTICTISLLLIFYKTKEMARTEEHQETQLIGDGELCLSRSLVNSSDKIIRKGGSSIFQHSVEGWKINSSLVLEIRKNILRFLDAERDVSVVKSSFKPGDVIHYVLDRRRTLNISQDLHSLLPEVSPMKNRRFKTCAVVGNSGVLLDSECGKEIDSHDFVIRKFIFDTLGQIDFITLYMWYFLTSNSEIKIVMSANTSTRAHDYLFFFVVRIIKILYFSNFEVGNTVYLCVCCKSLTNICGLPRWR
ncbi:hypothetical protein FD754_006587 [Muntiacus muntjak]|uniref:ST8 alpha-N-acetyl-neuraminide alpha-2,8-sialyltransferase 4 n=1 Tax=Muntiacus muntjak TaxID=9888 RepID=A0A5N3WL10_MUNMU|nr:hypothetical protein FD754_006587 [Muntiacus muntjak]